MAADVKKIMSPIEKLSQFWVSVIQLSGDGQRMEKLNSLLQILDIDSTIFHQSSPKRKYFLVRKYAIVEFLHKNKLQILITKLNSVKRNSLTTKLSKILQALLTGKEKGLLPFWTESSKEISKKLWLPTKTGSVDSDSNSYNISFNNIESNSWFSIKQAQMNVKSSLTTSSQLSQFFPQDITDIENTLMRSRKILLFPSPEQKQIFKQWIGTTRYLYNRAIDLLEKLYKERRHFDKSYIRKQLVTNIPKGCEWMLQTPQGLREGAIVDAVNAFFANLKKAKITGTSFTMKYRSKKDKSQSGVLVVDSLKPGFRLYPKILNDHSVLKIRNSEKRHITWRTKIVKGKSVGQILDHSLRLQTTRDGNWYLCVPTEINVAIPDNQGNPRLIDLDPGVRTFQTGYSPDGKVIKFGDNDINKIRNYCLKTDKLISIISKLSGKKRYRHNNALKKRYQKIKNWIKDCHRKIVKYLLDNYDIIMIPVFGVQQMCKKDQRRIHSKTVRNMLCWSHFQFRMMLQEKVKEYPKKQILVVTEEYTSKTCSCCGFLKVNLGGNKVFKCDRCKVIMERDINGARNILIKYLTEIGSII